ncbi:MAG: hypothetical protein WBN34_13490 [Woeseia sp.]
MCLTSRSSSAFAVSALIRDGIDWRLQPLDNRQTSPGADVQGCDGDLSRRFNINASWYDESGLITLLVSPL